MDGVEYVVTKHEMNAHDNTTTLYLIAKPIDGSQVVVSYKTPLRPRILIARVQMVEQVPSAAAALLAPRARGRKTQQTSIVPGSVAEQLNKYRPHSDEELVDLDSRNADTAAANIAGGSGTDGKTYRSVRVYSHTFMQP